jgi:hypothetical protein
MEIRRATSDDAGSLARIHVDAWRAAYRGLVPNERLATLSYARSEERLRRSIVEGTEETYVAWVAGEAVGFVTLGACRDADVDQETTGRSAASISLQRIGGRGWGLSSASSRKRL